jgi:hypothetical protein
MDKDGSIEAVFWGLGDNSDNDLHIRGLIVIGASINQRTAQLPSFCSGDTMLLSRLPS